jgi:hypothetical protein
VENTIFKRCVLWDQSFEALVGSVTWSLERDVDNVDVILLAVDDLNAGGRGFSEDEDLFVDSSDRRG